MYFPWSKRLSKKTLYFCMSVQKYKEVILKRIGKYIMCSSDKSAGVLWKLEDTKIYSKEY